MRVLAFCLTFLYLSSSTVLSNEDPVCSAQGLCQGNLVSALEEIPYKQKCVQVFFQLYFATAKQDISRAFL
jgi:hypothetical protein